MKKIESQYRSTPVDRTVAAKLIGYSSLSGPANKALAALASFGLLDRAGKGETRVTERARDILHAANGEQRKLRLLEAALEPELFREIRERFQGIPVPPEDGVITYLNRQGFNPSAVRPATKAFISTMLYLQELGVSEDVGGGAISQPQLLHPSDKNSRNGGSFGGAAVGDLVQWESEGVLKLEAAARVRAIQTHDGKEWVFVEGSETGIPMDEIVVEQKGSAAGAGKPPPTLSLNESNVVLAAKEREWLRGPLGKEVSYRLIVTGELGPREINKLIRLLEAQRDVLSDDSEA
ncbi:MAG: hypothetical protein V4527_06795 [Pseudomonadota bacterium]